MFTVWSLETKDCPVNNESESKERVYWDLHNDPPFDPIKMVLIEYLVECDLSEHYNRDQIQNQFIVYWCNDTFEAIEATFIEKFTCAIHKPTVTATVSRCFLIFFFLFLSLIELGELCLVLPELIYLENLHEIYFRNFALSLALSSWFDCAAIQFGAELYVLVSCVEHVEHSIKVLYCELSIFPRLHWLV